MYFSKHVGKHTSMPAALAYGALIGMGVILLGTAIIAQMLNMEIMEADKIGYGVMVLMIAAAYLGSKTAYSKIREKRILVSALCGLIVFAILLGLTAILFDGQYSGIGAAFLLILCGCGLASLPGREGRMASRKQISRIKTR